MRKYCYVRFLFYYVLMLIVYFFQPILLFIKEFVFFNDEDITMFNQLIVFSIGIILCLQYIVSIIPTITYFHMDKEKEYKRYWYSSVFAREKVYGNMRKILTANVFAFLVIETIIAILRFSQGKNLFVDFFWMPIVAFALSFGVVALETGLFLELRKKTNT